MSILTFGQEFVCPECRAVLMPKSGGMDGYSYVVLVEEPAQGARP